MIAKIKLIGDTDIAGSGYYEGDIVDALIYSDRKSAYIESTTGAAWFLSEISFEIVREVITEEEIERSVEYKKLTEDKIKKDLGSNLNSVLGQEMQNIQISFK